MPSRLRLIDGAERRSQSILRALADEIRNARLAAGVRQADVARAAGISQPQLSRLEHAKLPSVSLPVATRLAAAVGLDVSIRCYRSDRSSLRDVAHTKVIERLRAEVSPLFGWKLEAPVRPATDDARAFDVLLRGVGFRIGVEAETRLRDVQALVRRLALKQEASGVDRLVLAVAATRANRRALDEARDYLTLAFPLGSRQTLGALRDARQPAANGIVLV